jgi:hypothetical protein
MIYPDTHHFNKKGTLDSSGITGIDVVSFINPTLPERFNLPSTLKKA